MQAGNMFQNLCVTLFVCASVSASCCREVTSMHARIYIVMMASESQHAWIHSRIHVSMRMMYLPQWESLLEL